MENVFPDPWLYIVPMYAVAAVCTLFWRVASSGSLPEIPVAREWLWILALIFIPTILGHGLAMYSLKYLRGQTMTILNLGQFVFAGSMAYLVFRERPLASFAVTSLCVLGGALLVVRARD